LTLGLRRMYSAPWPLGPYICSKVQKCRGISPWRVSECESTTPRQAGIPPTAVMEFPSAQVSYFPQASSSPYTTAAQEHARTNGRHPVTLWDEMEARSRPRSFTSTGTLPAICAMSECRNVLFARHSCSRWVVRITKVCYKRW
jgi:hypothetical protein